MAHERLGEEKSKDTPGKETIVPESEPGTAPQREPGNTPRRERGKRIPPADAERSPKRREGVVSDPDC
jgi:hypothetical protein